MGESGTSTQGVIHFQRRYTDSNQASDESARTDARGLVRELGSPAARLCFPFTERRGPQSRGSLEISNGAGTRFEGCQVSPDLQMKEAEPGNQGVRTACQLCHSAHFQLLACPACSIPQRANEIFVRQRSEHFAPRPALARHPGPERVDQYQFRVLLWTRMSEKSILGLLPSPGANSPDVNRRPGSGQVCAGAGQGGARTRSVPTRTWVAG